MAIIRYTDTLPSGKQGLYIYLDLSGKWFVDIPPGNYSEEDFKFIRDIFIKSLEVEED